MKKLEEVMKAGWVTFPETEIEEYDGYSLQVLIPVADLPASIEERQALLKRILTWGRTTDTDYDGKELWSYLHAKEDSKLVSAMGKPMAFSELPDRVTKDIESKVSDPESAIYFLYAPKLEDEEIEPVVHKYTVGSEDGLCLKLDKPIPLKARVVSKVPQLKPKSEYVPRTYDEAVLQVVSIVYADDADVLSHVQLSSDGIAEQGHSSSRGCPECDLGYYYRPAGEIGRLDIDSAILAGYCLKCGHDYICDASVPIDRKEVEKMRMEKPDQILEQYKTTEKDGVIEQIAYKRIKKSLDQYRIK